MLMDMGIESKHKYDERVRKAHFWMWLGRKAMMAFSLLFGLIILTVIIVELFSVFGQSVSTGLFDDSIFALISLLILSSLVILACNFLKNLYQPGNSCDACNSL